MHDLRPIHYMYASTAPIRRAYRRHIGCMNDYSLNFIIWQQQIHGSRISRGVVSMVSTVYTVHASKSKVGSDQWIDRLTVKA